MDPVTESGHHGRGISIKCDRGSPCSSCKASNTVCHTTRGPLQKRQRVLISPRYEEEIATVSSRLARLETLIQTALTKLGSPLETDRTPSILENPPHVPGSLSFEGDSSFATHSKHTTQEFERLMGGLPYSKDGENAVASLRAAVYPGSINLRDPQTAALRPDFTGLPLPPRQLVIRILGYCKNNITRFFRDYPFLSLATFTDMCQQVYFPTDECTLSAFIIVNSGLCNLLRDLNDDTIKAMGLGTPTVASSISICATNVMRAVLDLRLTLDATFENILALLLSASTRMDWSSPSFDWRLISQASVLCQEAGYHRLPAASTSEEVRNKCLVFWYVWGFDVMFSFNLGRSPTLPDHDITTTRPLCPGDIDITWGHGFLSWLDSVRLQHEIYQHLYSGQAQTQSPETKIQHAQIFVERLLAMRQDFVAGKAGDGSESTRADVTAAEESFQLMFYSLLTLVYRVMPVPEQAHPLRFCDDCTSAARAALNIQRRAWEKIGALNDENWKLFLHWSVPLLLESRLIPRTEVARTLICSPFVPFIVVFSNAIATGDEADLQLLDQVVSSLQHAAQQSPSIAKLHHVCNAYHRVGRLYFEGGHRKRKSLESGETYNGVQGNSNDLTGTPSTLDTNSVLPIITWDGLFDEWNLGLGEENALEVNSFLGNYFSGNLEF
ncbi:hypothetical protein CDEST_10668 [Colletotrichum destructivum]|uniref:Xylanolytic transcriptional activator regulatory domain-containing protein n=1 Tax=Colletotrichum destructivum TaxID=34406 RepID=A0AAX4IR07_9PEZI|nr:hypothetical protein CDEST_10668 [Colletotrichum destructivum]